MIIIKFITYNNYKKYLFIDLTLIVLLLLLLIQFSFSMYGNYFEYSAFNSKVAFYDGDITVVIYEQRIDVNNNPMESYESVASIPNSDYYYYDSFCNNNSIINYNEIDKKISIDATKTDVCYILFRYNTSLK